MSANLEKYDNPNDGVVGGVATVSIIRKLPAGAEEVLEEVSADQVSAKDYAIRNHYELEDGYKYYIRLRLGRSNRYDAAIANSLMYVYE